MHGKARLAFVVVGRRAGQASVYARGVYAQGVRRGAGVAAGVRARGQDATRSWKTDAGSGSEWVSMATGGTAPAELRVCLFQ